MTERPDLPGAVPQDVRPDPPATAASPTGRPGGGDGDPSVGTPSRRERKAVLLRLDPAVHEALAHWAADDLRSLNGHVEWILRRALDGAGRSPKDARPGPGASPGRGGPTAP